MEATPAQLLQIIGAQTVKLELIQSEMTGLQEQVKNLMVQLTELKQATQPKEG